MELLLPYQVNLKSKDQNFMQLQQLIESKRNFLLEKQNKYKDFKKTNHFLEDIKNDYSNYSNYIMKQKNEQIQALDLLKNYVNDLSTSGSLSEQNIKDSKHEQNKIMNEIKKIKHNLNEIIQSNN
jgi:hypothetical protein